MMKRRDGWLVLAGLAVAMAVGGCRKEDGAQQASAATTEPAAGVVEAAGESVAAAVQVPSRAARPAFRERMSPEKFDERFKKAVAKLPAVAEREKEKGAAWGYRLTAVDKGSAGEKAGLKVGDTIVGIDGVRAWSEFRLGQLRKGVPQTLKVVGEDLKEREVVVPPGRIGVRGERRWEPELVYLRGPHRDGKWDDLVRVALVRMLDDPDLAETAMTRALAKGYPADGISDLVGYAVMAGRAETAEAALAFAHLREGSGEYGSGMPLWPSGLFWAALAEGDLATAAEAVRDGTPDAVRDRSAQIEGLIEARNGATTRPAGPTPSEMARRMKRTPMIEECQAVNAIAQTYLDQWRNGLPLRIASASGQYVPFVIKPLRPSQDVEVEIRFKLRPFDKQKSQWAKMFAVGLMDLADQRPTGSLDRDGWPGGILGLAVWGSNRVGVTIYHGHGEKLAWRPAEFKMDGKEEVSVRFVHVGGWDEIFVNGHRIVYVPWTASCKKMALYVKTVGMDSLVTGLSFDLLEEKK